MSFLFGSSPSYSNTNPGTHSTLSPQQTQIENELSSFLGSMGNFQNNYSGQLTAQLTPQQLATIQAFTGASGGAQGNLAEAQGGYSSAINTLEGVENSGPADFSNYYKTAVEQPLEQTFNQQTLPSLQRAFAASAGGGSSSDYMSGVNQAADNLDSTLAGAASSTALSEYNTNQTNKLNAASELGGLYSLPTAALGSILNAQGQVQQTQQATDTNAEQFAQQGVQNNQSLAQLLAQFLGTPTTASNNTVVTPGQSSGIGQLLSGLGSIGGLFGNNAGGTSAASGLLNFFQ